MRLYGELERENGVRRKCQLTCPGEDYGIISRMAKLYIVLLKP